MKRVLLITYYWPPSGGAGVQRVLKMVKYLREFGWEPVVYTALDPAYPVMDETLLRDVPEGQEVVRGKIWEPYEIFRRLIGQKGEKRVYSGFLVEKERPSLPQRLSVWVRGNCFIPDARRFWIAPSVRQLRREITALNVDAILSSGPPHSVHLIARGLKRATGLPWVADFRDPWTNIDFYDQLMLTPWADALHRRLEASVVRECDRLITVSWVWGQEFEALSGQGKVAVVTNGYDPADFDFEADPPEADFTLNHIGYLNADRNSPELWEVLGQLCRENEALHAALKLRFIGKTDLALMRDLAKNGLMDRAEFVPYVPHDEALWWLCRAQVLLLLVNDVPNAMGHIPGKTYEYLASRRPLLAVGPRGGDSMRIIEDLGAGETCPFRDRAAMRQAVLRLFERYQNGDLQGAEEGVERYSRRTATEQIAEILVQTQAQ